MSGDTGIDYDRAAEVWRVTVVGEDGLPRLVQGDDGQPAGWLDYTDADRVAQELSPPPKFSPDVLR